MPNRFLNLSEEELIAILDQGNLDQAEFAELVEAMEAKGLKGTIMAMPDSDPAAIEETKAYIEYHKKIKTMWTKPEAYAFINALSDSGADFEKKREALVSLAHMAKPEVFDALKKYNQNPDEELKTWSRLAMEECRGFLEAEIMGGGIKIS